MPCRHLITVLVFLHLLVLDQMRNVNEHSTLFGFTATDVLIERVKNLVDLNGESTGLGLAFPLSDCLFAELGEVVAANRHGKHNFFKGFAQRAVFHQQFQMHFRLALQSGHAFEKCPAIQANGAAKSFVGIKHRAEAERQDGGHLEAFTDHMSMLQ